MKRLGSSDSLGGLMSICHNSTGEENQGNSHVYSREFQSMMMMEGGLDEEGSVEESGGHILPAEKKRRLSIDQVKALEKNFEVDNKLEPDRKVKLAQELGLQPRQVAVWFQNRRARWKTKQLERDYGILKANYDALKLNFDNLQQENESLLQEIGELKSALEDDKDEGKVSNKGERKASENEHEEKGINDDDLHNSKESMDNIIVEYENEENAETDQLNFQIFNNNNNGLMGATLFTELKDGSSDSSDSSAILNEDNNNHNNNNHSVKSFFNSNGGFQFLNTKDSVLGDAHMEKYHPQFVKIEEHNFFGGDDSCTTFFSDDQPPSLQWDCPEQWN